MPILSIGRGGRLAASNFVTAASVTNRLTLFSGLISVSCCFVSRLIGFRTSSRRV